MGTRGYRADYREAFACANLQLEQIYGEFHQLQARKVALESAVASLEPFLKSARIPAHEEYRAPEPVYESIAPESEAIPEPEPEPITYSYETTAVTRAYAPEPVAQSWEPEPVRHSFQTEPVIHTSYAEPEPVAVPEPVAPSYAPVSDANVDPIQARINRALGLAVA